MGVRGRKSARTRVVKIVGKTPDRVFRAKGVHTNLLTGLVDTSLPLHHAYARLGLCSEPGLDSKKKKDIQESLPSHAKREELPEFVPAKKIPQVVTEDEHVFVDRLVEKHGLNYKAMAKDIKLNTFQHTAKQLRKMVTKVIRTEKLLFPEKFEGMYEEEGLIGDISSDGEW